MLSTLKGRLSTRIDQALPAVGRFLYVSQLKAHEARYAEPPLTVLTIGKVGSKTVVASLKAAHLDRHIYHLHHLSPEILSKISEKKTHPKQVKYLWKCRYVRQQLESGRWRGPAKIVTLVRDPVARNLSDFFQNLSVSEVAPDEYQVRSSWHDFDITVHEHHLDKLIDLFNTRYDHDIHTYYFDREFKGVLGVDILDGTFPKDQGFGFFQGDRAEVLLIKLEALQNSYVTAFEQFLNLTGIPLVSQNKMEDRDAGLVYRWFKNAITFADTYLDRMYTSRYARTFYSDAELKAFYHGWSKHPR